jgi:assimilatory nitrate reductase catalytic subunit
MTTALAMQSDLLPDRVRTHCCYCAFQCGMEVIVDREMRRVVGVQGNPEFPVNRGQMCIKGHTSAETLYHSDRLLYPLIRRRGRLMRAGWDEALALTAHSLREIQAAHGLASVGVYGGGALTNEKAYLLGKFARVALRTPHIDYNGRFCMSSAAHAQRLAFGLDRGLPMPLRDIPKAACLLLVGSNAAETLPPLMGYFREARLNGCTMVVVDPRYTATARQADMHLAIRPGTDLALANALLTVIADEGLLDTAFLAARTKGFPEALAAARALSVEEAATICGLDAEAIRGVARIFAQAPTGMVLTSRGSEQHTKGTDTVLAWINLVLATGKIGREGCGFGALTGQGNGQGGREHGQKCDQLPGYLSIANPAHRAHIAAVWGIEEPDLPGPGLPAYELLEAVSDARIRGLLVVGSNPAVSAPDLQPVNRGLDRLEFLAVADFFVSETAQRADVVFPAAQWAEEEGTVTNLEGRVLLRRQATPPAGEARSDVDLLISLAHRLGAGRFFPYHHPREVFEELRRATAGCPADYSGITWRRIEQEDGIFWPCPHVTHPGTPRLFEERFATAGGLAVLHPVRYRPAAEEPDAEYPLRLTTGRVLQHYLSGNQTRRVAALRQARPEPYAELHPTLAAAHGICPGDRVRLRTRRGCAEFAIRLSQGIRADTIFVPFHWGGRQAVNLLTNPARDPASHMPEFKVCAVALERVAAAPAA